MLVHRDLNSNNVFLRVDGHAVISDCCLARPVQQLIGSDGEYVCIGEKVELIHQSLDACRLLHGA